MEKEKDGCLSFSDVSISCENKKFITNFYQRRSLVEYIPTLSNFIMNFIN